LVQQESDVLAKEVLFEETDHTVLTDQYQAKAANVLADYALSARFNPLFPNPHVQSIGGFLARQRGGGIGAYVGSAPKASSFLFELLLASSSTQTRTPIEAALSWESRERIETPDGDWFYADSVSCRTSSAVTCDSDDNDDDTSTTTPTLLLIHGLESNSESPLTREMARSVVDFMHVTCLNFRGCTVGEPNDTIGGYHLGFTDDLHHYLTILQQRRPKAGVFLAGFSLGANVVLKCVGELGVTAVTKYNIMGCMALAAPLDQERNALALARPGVNRLVYTNMLLKSMKAKAQFQLDRFCNGNVTTTTFDYPRAMAAETITDFDDAFIAPIYNFTDCWDYYRTTSSIYYLNAIAVPTLIVNAHDDPFFDPAVWPSESTGRHVQMERMDHGGHLGFYFHQLPEGDPVPETSWAPNEMRLFFQHVLRRTQRS
jgi:uncharacterized protein